jgi:hypothetical protein
MKKLIYGIIVALCLFGMGFNVATCINSHHDCFTHTSGVKVQEQALDPCKWDGDEYCPDVVCMCEK